MKLEIVIGNEPYLIDEYVKNQINGYEVNRVSSFTEEELLLVRQKTIFGKNAVIITENVDKEQESRIEKLINQDPDYPGILLYVPRVVDKRKKLFKSKAVIKINKPSLNEAMTVLSNVAFENQVDYEKEVIEFLIDYSEYSTEDAMSLYDLIGVIRAVSGGELTEEHIKSNLQRTDKEDAFKLITLIGKKDQLVEYMSRLKTNPYMMIGALLYAFRIMAKLKLSNDIGVSQYVKSQYTHLSENWTLSELFSKMKALNEIKTGHESTEVMKSLIIMVLIN